MGAARYWDDPEADTEETVDLPLPESVRTRPDAPPAALRVLKEVIDAIRLVGGVLAVVGLGVIFANLNRGGRDFARIAIPVTSLAVIPGSLYLVAAEGLVRRRYWAWVMSLIVTILLMVTIVALGVYAAVTSLRHVEASGFLCPGALYFSMPCLILIYMVRALPVVREAELLTVKGFNVLPAVRVEPIDVPDDEARRRVEDEYERTAPGPAAISPARMPLAPSQPPPPRRS